MTRIGYMAFLFGLLLVLFLAAVVFAEQTAFVGGIRFDMPNDSNMPCGQVEIYEPAETEAMRRVIKQGDVVIDVGAHVGIHTVTMSRLVGSDGLVFAIEPDPTNYRYLLRNIQRAGCMNVCPLAVAAGDSVGTLTLYLSCHGSGHSIATENVNSSGNSVEVPVLPIDLIVSGRKVTCIKCDAQGADVSIMRGARRTIERCKPAVIVEYWPAGIKNCGDDPQDMFRFFDGWYSTTLRQAKAWSNILFEAKQ